MHVGHTRTRNGVSKITISYCNNNNISSKYNQSTMFPVKHKCDT